MTLPRVFSRCLPLLKIKSPPFFPNRLHPKRVMDPLPLIKFFFFPFSRDFRAYLFDPFFFSFPQSGSFALLKDPDPHPPFFPRWTSPCFQVRGYINSPFPPVAPDFFPNGTFINFLETAKCFFSTSILVCEGNFFPTPTTLTPV